MEKASTNPLGIIIIIIIIIIIERIHWGLVGHKLNFTC